MALSGAEAVLEKYEELLDHYLPMTDEELGKKMPASYLPIEETKEGVQQKLQESQERLHQIESQTLAMSYHITQQLQAAYKNLIASIQGLPANFQQNIQLAYHNIEELHTYFTSAHSFKDLPNSILSQSQEKALKAQEYVDDILDYVLHNAPMSWLVGPFSPSPQKPDDVKPTKPDDPNKEDMKAAVPKESL
ncbi:perilipin-3-like [Lacerta agilis]|uniref:perilipin-3-like n=1 Tax=Lacerta agilis TaxID=80427 RepID=UPI0014195955|nr:perilipin-3-like [Lacerta agilis]